MDDSKSSHPDAGGSVATRVFNEYERAAADYDRRWDEYVRQTVDASLARLTLGAGQRLLDVGCGTGRLLAALVDRYPDTKLAGIDFAPAMLAQARERLADDVALMHSSADGLPYPDASFDVVTSVSVLHCVSDPAAAIVEMARVLKSGGRLVLTDWCGDFVFCRLVGLYLRWRGTYARALTADSLARLARSADFNDLTLERYRLNRRWGLMTLTARRRT